MSTVDLPWVYSVHYDGRRSFVSILYGDTSFSKTCKFLLIHNILVSEVATRHFVGIKVTETKNPSDDVKIEFSENSLSTPISPTDSTTPTGSSIYPSTLNFIESSRGGSILLRAGYKYRINKRNKHGSSIWLCMSYFCSSTLSLDVNLSNITRETPHCPNCSPDIKGEIVSIAINNCKKRVRTESGPISRIYESELRKLGAENFVDDIPPFSKVKNTFYRSRSKSQKVDKQS